MEITKGLMHQVKSLEIVTFSASQKFISNEYSQLQA